MGGKVRIFEKYDPDTSNIIDLRDMVKEMGYNNFKLWYLEPYSILQLVVKSLGTDRDALKLVELDFPINEHVDDETGSEGLNSYMNVDAEEDDDGWLHESIEDKEDDDNDWLYESDDNEEDDDNAFYMKVEVQRRNGVNTSTGITEDNGAGNDARKNVRNYAGTSIVSAVGNAGRKNATNDVSTSFKNAMNGHVEGRNERNGSNERSVGRALTSGHTNGNIMGEVHWDSDELVNLASSDEGENTMRILVYGSVGD
nr:putative carbonic anhydrase 2 [Ziziphus jujuba var. spinosa]